MPGDNDFNNCVCSTDVNCDIGYDYCYDRDIFHFKDCSGGTYTTTNSDGDPNTGGQGGGSNTTNPPPPNTTIGVPFSLYEFLAEECLNSGYNPNSLNNTVVPIDLSNFNLTPEQEQDIFNYLNIENGCSEEAKGFIRNIIESLEDTNFTFDELVQLYDNLDKVCQGKQIESFIRNTDSPIVNFILDTFSGNANYNFSMEDVDLPIALDANANTIFPAGLNFNSNSAVIIQFDNSYLDSATDLSIVITAAHEFVHAHLAYLYSEGQLLTDYPQYTDLNTAFSAFQNNSNETTGELLGDAMHDVYDDFLDWITQSVYTYATDNNIEGATQEYCSKLVIGSHQYTDAFQDLDETEQNAYSIISVNEKDGTTQAKGTNCD